MKTKILKFELQTVVDVLYKNKENMNLFLLMSLMQNGFNNITLKPNQYIGDRGHELFVLNKGKEKYIKINDELIEVIFLLKNIDNYSEFHEKNNEHIELIECPEKIKKLFDPKDILKKSNLDNLAFRLMNEYEYLFTELIKSYNELEV